MRPHQDHAPPVPPLGVLETLVILLAAVIPMGLLAFGATPLLIPRVDIQPGLVFWAMIVLGMIWQFLLAVWLLRRERRHWTWPELKARLWLTPPIHPSEAKGKMLRLVWIVPLGALAVLAVDAAIAWWIDPPFAALLPDWLNPPYNDIESLASEENFGNWPILGLALVSALFNYLLGEYLLFHGVLLPRMVASYGRWAWLVNAVVFGLYHIHVAFRMPSVIVSNIAYVLPSQAYRSTWPALLIHAVEGVVVLAMVTWVILGMPGS